ncbi:MAG: hypothetical protein JWP87_973 [Labilithrix sp.]|nr:hypothetical protein [Labilithrix sp.]
MAKGATSLDQALDALYAASPAEFTAKRDALAKELKASGDAAASAEVKAQRKPTQIAYVLNQLARRHADDLAELVDVGRELARAQRKALRGEAGHDLRDAITRQRSVVRELTTKTAALMGDLGVTPAGHLDEIASALQAALVDPAVGAKLEEGRLDKVPAPAAGFPGATAQAVEEAEPAPKPKPKTEPKPKPHARAEAEAEAKANAKADAEAEEKERAARLAAAKAAGAEAEERAREADEAEREADGHAAQAKKLADEARALDAEAKRLAAEAKRVAREAEAASRAADRASAEATRAAKAAKTARTVATRAQTAAEKHARAAGA